MQTDECSTNLSREITKMILVCNTHFCQGPFIGSCHQYLQESCQLGTSYGSSCWRNSKGAKVVKLSYAVRCVFKSLIDDLLSLNVSIIITINHPCNYIPETMQIMCPSSFVTILLLGYQALFDASYELVSLLLVFRSQLFICSL